MSTSQMLSVEEARNLIFSNVSTLSVENVSVLEAVGRICASDVVSDIDVSPFAHSAMDGYALHASSIESASESNPVELSVIAEIGAGDVFSGTISKGECIRIMTGAEVPASADSVVKYEDVNYMGSDGKTGTTVSFSSPTKLGSNIRPAGEEAKAGETIMRVGEIINSAGVGFLASCGAIEVSTFARPHVAIMATGSELVPPTEIPSPGHIRESNSYAMAACVQSVGGIAHICPIVKDDFNVLKNAVEQAASKYDFVITTGGAANGDFDFIKPVVENSGELLMSLVNMRPGKAQTFGIVSGTPVFGLPGNPAAAYCGFQMLIRPALLKMQGHTHLDLPIIKAKISCDMKKRDPRRIYLRSTIEREADGTYLVTPAKNQSSGLFSTLQRGNCLAIMPEGTSGVSKGDTIDCIMLDIPEYTAL